MQKTLMYIHGYGSTGQAYKAQTLQRMFPESRLIAPTFDYDHAAPFAVFEELKATINTEHPDLILGSSTGGYYALCCTQFYDGPVWCVNPVREIIATIKRIIPDTAEGTAKQLEAYRSFDQEVFQRLQPHDGQLHFALSTDDELLGDHHPLLTLFPNHGSVVWKSDCGHRFFRFEELEEAIRESL